MYDGNRINGDGNVLGNGNNVVVHKTQTTINERRTNRNDNDAGVAFGGVAVFAIALSIAAFEFARNANLFYATASWLAAAQAIVALVVGIFELRSGQNQNLLRLMIACAISVATFATAWLAWKHYPVELVRIAQEAATSKHFWCSLSDHGHSVALEHLLAFLPLAAGVLVLTPSSLALVTSLTGLVNVPLHLVEKVSGAWIHALAAACLGLTWLIHAFSDEYSASLTRMIGFVVTCGAR